MQKEKKHVEYNTPRWVRKLQRELGLRKSKKQAATKKAGSK
ncbi:hypothetical protein [Metabacillus malikii]|uniref:Uncharacterized protein n=1 Tax=Metabacillus malikii TaxID=1504265 RepID=A0ABT9ZP77_9BACI|nr:hypothetical protein [Metabacillus malikii]MDQ0233030.1 hypothetical protein [Metabacillus malikii]